jgi:hypothetical protein
MGLLPKVSKLVLLIINQLLTHLRSFWNKKTHFDTSNSPRFKYLKNPYFSIFQIIRETHIRCLF